MLSLNNVTQAQFEARTQETFQLILKDGSWPLKLVQVRPAGSAAPTAIRPPFALTFRSETPIRLPQAIYRLENAHLGPMEIFLVQSSPTEVEAVFS